MRNITRKNVAGSRGEATSTIAVPNVIKSKGWSDVMGSMDMSKKRPVRKK